MLPVQMLMRCVHFYSPDLKNAEGVTPLELASSPDLQKALRTHLNIKTPEKLSRDQNAAAALENETEMSACATEATEVNETLEEMFAEQESVEQEIVIKPAGDTDQLNTELVETEKEAIDDDHQNVGAVKEEEDHQESEPLEDSVDEVEEISSHIVANMEVEVKVEADEEAKGTESKVEDIEVPLPPVAAAVSPDSNKENLGSSSLDTSGDPQEKGADEEKEKSPSSMMLGGLRKPKNPFTEIRRSTSSSRAAMLVRVRKCKKCLASHQFMSGFTGNRATT